MERDLFYSELTKFLKERNPEIKDIQIEENTNLIQEGILDSFSVVELIMFIEKTSNKRLEVERLNSKSIESLSGIYEYFIKNNY